MEGARQADEPHVAMSNAQAVEPQVRLTPQSDETGFHNVLMLLGGTTEGTNPPNGLLNTAFGLVRDHLGPL